MFIETSLSIVSARSEIREFRSARSLGLGSPHAINILRLRRLVDDESDSTPKVRARNF
jgi:hypothetical protein